jgi:hypothetical protein
MMRDLLNYLVNQEMKVQLDNSGIQERRELLDIPKYLGGYNKLLNI